MTKIDDIASEVIVAKEIRKPDSRKKEGVRMIRKRNRGKK